MGDVLYIQTEKNRKITDPHVRLGDIADLTSNNPEVLQRCKVLRVLTLEPEKYGRYTVSAMELIWLIQKKEEKVEVDHVGEPQFILTYEDPAGKKYSDELAENGVCMPDHILWNDVFYHDFQYGCGYPDSF